MARFTQPDLNFGFGLAVGAALAGGLLLGYSAVPFAINWPAVAAAGTIAAAVAAAVSAVIALNIAERSMSAEERERAVRATAVDAVLGPYLFGLAAPLSHACVEQVGGMPHLRLQQLSEIQLKPMDELARWLIHLDPEEASALATAAAKLIVVKETAERYAHQPPTMTRAIMARVATRDASEALELIRPAAERMWKRLHGETFIPWHGPILPLRAGG